MIDALKNAGAGLIAASWWTDVAWPVIWVLLGIIAIRKGTADDCRPT